jgi:hypothetical protein
MAKDDKIVKDIIGHVGNANKSEWYVGIATDAKQRLFVDHNVVENGGHWIYRSAGSEQVARDTEKYLLDTYNFRGGTGGGDNPIYVYAYKITPSTLE